MTDHDTIPVLLVLQLDKESMCFRTVDICGVTTTAGPYEVIFRT